MISQHQVTKDAPKKLFWNGCLCHHYISHTLVCFWLFEWHDPEIWVQVSWHCLMVFVWRVTESQGTIYCLHFPATGIMSASGLPWVSKHHWGIRFTSEGLRPSDTYISGLEQERRNSIANALELRLSYTNPLISISNLGIICSDNGLLFVLR